MERERRAAGDGGQDDGSFGKVVEGGHEKEGRTDGRTDARPKLPLTSVGQTWANDERGDEPYFDIG